VSGSNISTGDLLAQILNYGGASIGDHAEVDITAGTLSVNGSLDSRIDNSQSGSINGSAAIDFSVSGNSTITNDAMFQILGSDGAPAPRSTSTAEITMSAERFSGISMVVEFLRSTARRLLLIALKWAYSAAMAHCESAAAAFQPIRSCIFMRRGATA